MELEESKKGVEPFKLNYLTPVDSVEEFKKPLITFTKTKKKALKKKKSYISAS